MNKISPIFYKNKSLFISGSHMFSIKMSLSIKRQLFKNHLSMILVLVFCIVFVDLKLFFESHTLRSSILRKSKCQCCHIHQLTVLMIVINDSFYELYNCPQFSVEHNLWWFFVNKGWPCTFYLILKITLWVSLSYR